MTVPADSAKDYLYGKEIPKMFECVLSALMHHQPANPVSFLRDCFVQMKEQGGADGIGWNTFVDQAPPPTSKTKIAQLKAEWQPLLVQRPTLPAIPSHPTAIKQTRPVICLLGADRKLLRDVSSLLMKQYDFMLRHIGQEPLINDVTSCTNTIASWIDVVTRQHSFCSGFLLTEYPPSRSHLDAFFKKKVSPPHLLLIIHLFNKKPLTPMLKACLERARSSTRGVHVVDYEAESADDACLMAISAIAERFRIHPSPHRRTAAPSTGLGNFAITAGSNEEIQAIKPGSVQADPGRKSDLRPSIPLILVYVGPESKDYVDRLSALPKVQCFAQQPTDSDEKAHQQLLAALILADEDAGVVCVNFPRSETQLQWLLARVGGISSAAIVDYSEQALSTRMVNSSKMTPATSAAALQFYKEQTIPTVHWIDRSGKLQLICQIERDDDEPRAFEQIEDFISVEITGKGKKRDEKMAAAANQQPAAAGADDGPPAAALTDAQQQEHQEQEHEQPRQSAAISQPTPPPSRSSSRVAEQSEQLSVDDNKAVETVAAVTVGAVILAAALEAEQPEEPQPEPQPEQETLAVEEASIRQEEELITTTDEKSQLQIEEAILELENAIPAESAPEPEPEPENKPVADQPAVLLLQEPEIVPETVHTDTGLTDPANPDYSATLDGPSAVENLVAEEEEVVPPTTAEDRMASFVIDDVLAEAIPPTTDEERMASMVVDDVLMEVIPPTTEEERVASAVVDEVMIEAQEVVNATGVDDNPNPDYSAVLDAPADEPTPAEPTPAEPTLAEPPQNNNEEDQPEVQIAPEKIPSRRPSQAEVEDIHEKLKNSKVVFVLGGPGSGKGTQCAKLVEKYGFAHLSTGDLLRAEVASGSARGKKLEAAMAAGELVTLDTVLELLRDAMLAKAGAGNAPGFLVDGFPRELDQAIRFEKEIKAPDAVLFFDVSEATMRARLLKRGETSGRVDDNEETIVKRFHTFEQHSRPVVDHYVPTGKLHKFHAESTPDEIFTQVAAIISPLMGK